MEGGAESRELIGGVARLAEPPLLPPASPWWLMVNDGESVRGLWVREGNNSPRGGALGANSTRLRANPGARDKARDRDPEIRRGKRQTDRRTLAGPGIGIGF